MPNLFDQDALQQALAKTQASTPEDSLPGLGSHAIAPSDSLTPWNQNNKIGIGPYAALIGGQALDLGTSLHGFGNGYGEVNPMYKWMGQTPSAGLTIAKGLQTALTARAMKKLAESNHPRAAKILGYAGGAAGAIPGLINLHTMSKGPQ